MKKLKLLTTAFVFMFLQFSCTAPQTFNEAQVLQAIQEEISSYSNALREGDLPRVLDSYMDEAVVIPPDGDMIRGKKAIGEMYQALWQLGMKEVTLTTIEIGGCGDIAYEIGRTKVQIQPEGMKAMSDSTKYLVVWKRQPDGKWKVYADIYNFSVPVSRP